MKGYGLLITSNFYSLSSTKFTYSALEYFLPNVPKISERSLENVSYGDHFFLNWDSLHARMNSYYEPWSYKKKKHKKNITYRKSL